MSITPLTLDEICRQAEADTGELLRVIEIAEEQIGAAQARHPERAALLHHAFPLLFPAVPEMTELAPFIYAGHCRELLERVAAGDDTRPGTAAEILMVMRHVSEAIPLHGPGYGFYLRMWHQACPDVPYPWPDPDGLRREVEHYERMEGNRIDPAERFARQKLTCKRRVIGTPGCDGQHHGRPVAGCPFTVPAAFRRPAPAGPPARARGRKAAAETAAAPAKAKEETS